MIGRSSGRTSRSGPLSPLRPVAEEPLDGDLAPLVAGLEHHGRLDHADRGRVEGRLQPAQLAHHAAPPRAPSRSPCSAGR